MLEEEEWESHPQEDQEHSALETGHTSEHTDKHVLPAAARNYKCHDASKN